MTPHQNLPSDPGECTGAKEMASVFKALGDNNRLCIVYLLARDESGRLGVSDLARLLGISQPAVSQHLKILRAEKIVHAEKNGMTYVSSFEDAMVISGQGTAGFEMFSDEPDIELLIIPAGGGGLMNGIAIAAKALNPDVEIWGVQSVASNPWVVSWADGIVREVTYLETLADGLAGYIPQSLLSLAKKRVTGILEITEEDIAKAIAFLHREHHQIVEGAGARSCGSSCRQDRPERKENRNSNLRRQHRRRKA